MSAVDMGVELMSADVKLCNVMIIQRCIFGWTGRVTIPDSGSHLQVTARIAVTCPVWYWRNEISPRLRVSQGSEACATHSAVFVGKMRYLGYT